MRQLPRRAQFSADHLAAIITHQRLCSESGRYFCLLRVALIMMSIQDRQIILSCGPAII